MKDLQAGLFRTVSIGRQGRLLFTKKRKCTNILFVDNPDPFLKVAIANQVNLFKLLVQ